MSTHHGDHEASISHYLHMQYIFWITISKFLKPCVLFLLIFFPKNLVICCFILSKTEGSLVHPKYPVLTMCNQKLSLNLWQEELLASRRLLGKLMKRALVVACADGVCSRSMFLDDMMLGQHVHCSLGYMGAVNQNSMIRWDLTNIR